MATKSNILRNFKNIQCVIVPGVTIYVTNFKKHIYFWRFYSTSWRKGVPSLFSFSCNSFFYLSFTRRSYLVHTSSRQCSYLKRQSGINGNRDIHQFPLPPWYKYKTRPALYVEYRNERKNTPFYFLL